MTETEVRAALAAFDGPGGMERWIAAQPWFAAAGGWVVPEPFHGLRFQVEPAPGGVRVVPEPGPVTPNDILNFPVTVYEKCADRIGVLGADTAADVVSFYNFLNGFRVNVKMALGDHDFSLEARSLAIASVVNMLATERKRIEALQVDLRKIVAG